MVHSESSPLKHKTVLIKFAGEGLDGHPGTKNQILPVFIEDWWDIIDSRSWLHQQFHNLGAIYAKRLTHPDSNIPVDDEVLYAKIYDDVWGIGFLIHTSEVIDISPISEGPPQAYAASLNLIDRPCTCYLGGGSDYRGECARHGTLAPEEKK